jgi:hypothetical protein
MRLPKRWNTRHFPNIACPKCNWNENAHNCVLISFLWAKILFTLNISQNTFFLKSCTHRSFGRCQPWCAAPSLAGTRVPHVAVVGEEWGGRTLWRTSADSTSAVPIRCPDTLITWNTTKWAHHIFTTAADDGVRAIDWAARDSRGIRICGPYFVIELKHDTENKRLNINTETWRVL